MKILTGKWISKGDCIFNRSIFKAKPRNEEEDPIFIIAATTPYPIDDITDFMALTGIQLKETEVLLKRFDECGISNLKDVNTLAKLGYFHYS